MFKWAFFGTFCLLSKFVDWKMYILVTLSFNFTQIHHGMIEIAWYHKHRSSKFEKLITCNFSIKFWAIWVQKEVKLRYYKWFYCPRTFWHPLRSCRRSPEVMKNQKHFLQPILPILGSNESLWNSKTFDMPLTLVSGRMVENFEFEMSTKQEVAPFLGGPRGGPRGVWGGSEGIWSWCG